MPNALTNDVLINKKFNLPIYITVTFSTYDSIFFFLLMYSVNAIQSLSHFQNCSELTELFLRKNKVADINEVRFLQKCPVLRVLWISDNPIDQIPHYRSTVIRALPFLEKLDNICAYY